MFGCPCYCNVQNPAVFVKSLLESYISDVISEKLLENSDIHEEPFFTESFKPSPKRILLFVGKSCKIVLLPVKKILNRFGGKDRGNNAASAASCYNFGHTTCLN
jgi:hypothetical protein